MSGNDGIEGVMVDLSIVANRLKQLEQLMFIPELKYLQIQFRTLSKIKKLE